jgi:cytochrome c553
MTRLHALLVACSCLGVEISICGAAEPRQVTFEEDVRPILKTHCFLCHGEDGHREGGLDLRLRHLAASGGDSGPAILPGTPETSRLFQRIRNGEMPPGEDKRLTEQEVRLIGEWIAAGAPTAREEPASLGTGPYFTVEEKNWWAFRPIVRATLPATRPAKPVATPIDALLLARLRASAGQHHESADAFRFAPRADRSALIRRVYLDLLGLPPTPHEVTEFSHNQRADAWPRLLDRVLASPHYGERWARHWLDLAGYADSEGYIEEDPVRAHAYGYRDYVIRALNSDKPYDRFLLEQLAGDELVGWPQATLTPRVIETLSATGFLRMAPDGTASGEVDQDLARNQVVADTLQIMGTTLLGMTVQCAQCHDHRYDPIPQSDYYRLRALFEPALDWKDWRTPRDRKISLYTDADHAIRDNIESEARILDAQHLEKVDFYIERTLEHELLIIDRTVRSELRTAYRTPADQRSPEQQQLLEDHINIAQLAGDSLYLYDRRRDARARDLDQRREEEAATYLARVQQAELEKIPAALRDEVLVAVTTDEATRTPGQQQLAAQHPGVGVTIKTLPRYDATAAKELEQYTIAAAEIRKFRIREHLKEFSDGAQAIRDTIPVEPFLRALTEVPGKVPATFVFYRGAHQQPRDEVQPGGLSVLNAELPPAADRLSTSARRLRYARHLTDKTHPLVARVMANRIWLHHFGQGLVPTPGDFGKLGVPPTHPQLLDWLAAEFMASDWSIKRLHRLIFSSHAYQQSTTAPPALVQADPGNRFYGRWPLRRLESEVLRDTILFTAGKLNTQMHGPPVPVMEDEVGRIVIGKENLDGERKPVDPVEMHGQQYRRSVYVQARRTRPLGVLETFDLAGMAPNCTQRPESNVAPQALMLMNSDFIVAMAGEFARRLMCDSPREQTRQLRRGWELAFNRVPSDDQMRAADSFVRTQLATLQEDQPDLGDSARYQLALATYCQALFSSNRFLYIE